MQEEKQLEEAIAKTIEYLKANGIDIPPELLPIDDTVSHGELLETANKLKALAFDGTVSHSLLADHAQSYDNPHLVTADQVEAPKLVKSATPGNLVEFAYEGELADSGKSITDLAPVKHTHPNQGYVGGRGNVINDGAATVGNLPIYDATSGHIIKDSGYQITDFELSLTGNTELLSNPGFEELL